MNLFFCLYLICKYRLVQAWLVIRDVVLGPKPLFYIIGIKDCHLSCLFKTFRPHGPYICICPHKDPEVPVEGPQSAYRIGTIVFQRNPLIFFDNPWNRQERLQFLFYPYRPGTRTAAAVRGGECLVKIHVYHLNSPSPKPCNPKEGIHVGPVAVYDPSLFMDYPGYLLNVPLKEAQSIGIGDHNPCSVLIHNRPYSIRR